MDTIIILKNGKIAAYYPLGDLEKVVANYPNDTITKTSQVSVSVDLGDPRTQQEIDDHWKLQQEIGIMKANWQKANDSNLDNLRIFKYIPRSQNPLLVDFSLLGLKKGIEEYSFGRITKKTYLDSSDNVVVERVFVDVEGETFQIKTTSRWYTTSDAAALEKDDYKQYSAQEKEKLMRDRRARQVTILVASGKDTAAEPLFADIFSTYSEKISEFIETGSESLKDALENPSLLMLATLNTLVPDLWNEGQTITIRGGIIRELYPS